MKFKKKCNPTTAEGRNTDQSHRRNRTKFYSVIESGGEVREYKVKVRDET